MKVEDARKVIAERALEVVEAARYMCSAWLGYSAPFRPDPQPATHNIADLEMASSKLDAAVARFDALEIGK